MSPDQDLEEIINRGNERGTLAASAAARGNLLKAATRFADASARVAIVTGFYLPLAEPPAAETDGPVGTALLAAVLHRAGVPVRVITDTWAAPVVGATLGAAACPRTMLSVVADAEEINTCGRRLVDDEISDLFFVERPGSAADGHRYSMRGNDVSACNLALEPLLDAGGWTTLSMGDGGNEIGMGSFSPDLFLDSVPNASEILAASRTDIPMVAAVSNWGCYGLAALLSVLDSRFSQGVEDLLTRHTEQILIQAALAAGAVDGVLLRPNPSTDGHDLDVSGDLIDRMRAVLD